MKFNSYDSPAALQQTPLPPEGGGVNWHCELWENDACKPTF